MTVLSVVKRVALKIGHDRPDMVFGATDRTELELADCATDTADMIAKAFDWQVLQQIQTYTGNGVSDGFDLPTDYDRMVEGADMWSNRWTWPFNHIASTNEWLEYLTTPYTFVSGNWTIYGGQFHFLPIMSSTDVLKFFYVTKNKVKAAGGGLKESFTVDTDEFRLSENLLRLGMIWKWKSQKGIPYDEDIRAYETEFNKLMLSDKGARGVVRSGDMRLPRNVRVAFPQNVGG
jgi:hypothetical protein